MKTWHIVLIVIVVACLVAGIAYWEVKKVSDMVSGNDDAQRKISHL